MILPLLCLLSLCLGHLGVQATSVHEVAISVRSVKSIVYRGMQVSIFEHIEMPRRYFFQPLSFLDANSARLADNLELKITELHFDIYLWTDEFIQLVESHFAEHKSVELLPLTEISLVWSRHASLWLGPDFNRTYRLLDDWKDGDKPHMRSTFTIFCDRRDACERLTLKFNQSNEAIGNLFDLRYKIQCDNTRNFSLTVRSSHFLQSSTFQQLDRFASQHGSGEVIVSEKTADELADQVYTAALAELQREAKQQLTSVVSESHRAIVTQMHSQLRSNQVHSLSDFQWKSRVFWPERQANLRPDKLARIFNELFKPAPRQLLMVTLPNAGSLASASETLLPTDFTKISAFVQAHTGQRKGSEPPVVSVDDVSALAGDLGSSSAWDVSKQQFSPPPSLILFRVDLLSVRRRGIFLMRDITVNFKVSQHMDPVHPLPKDTEFQSSLWQRHFAGSFCILANRGEPPNMQCRVLSYMLPTKSLQRDIRNPLNSPRPSISYNGGHIGQSHFYQVNPDEFSFSIKICCTKDLENP